MTFQNLNTTPIFAFDDDSVCFIRSLFCQVVEVVYLYIGDNWEEVALLVWWMMGVF
jgi:hypothetical protein